MDPETYRARRAQLMERLGCGVAVIGAGPEAVRVNDVHHVYRPASDLLYLTGFAEPEAVCVIAPRHPERRFVLFVRERDEEREVWDGARAGVPGAKERFGADEAHPIGQLVEKLPEYLLGAEDLHYSLGRDESLDRRVLAALAGARRKVREGKVAPIRIVDPHVSIGELRLRKSAAEVERIRRAVEVTREAHTTAMRRARPGMGEYQVEAMLLEVFRRHGGEPAYPCIVGAGANGTVLHYVDNRGRIAEGDMLMIDAGVELDWHASDVTRTFVPGGRFSDPQRALYRAVLRAQAEALALIRPGSTLDAAHARAIEVLVEELVRLGLLSGDPETIVKEGKHKRFYPHRTSHWLGLDVHDAGLYYRAASGPLPLGQPPTLEPRVLQAGMVLTVEPGLYVRPADDVDRRWHGLAVRIEDDVLVSPEGHEVLSRDVPREIEEVEALTLGRV